jgi:hypothetical protein
MLRRSILAVLAAVSLLATTAGASVLTSTPSDPTVPPPNDGRAATEPNPDRPLLQVSVDPDGSVSVGGNLSVPGSCDEIDPRSCLLPFPNDRFTVPDTTTDTGRRVHFDLLSMPRDVAGKPIDPTEWNRNDGFSPSTPILTYVPGLSLAATWGTKAPTLTDLARSLQPDAPVVLLDATTGKRQPLWTELDQHPATTDGSRLLQIRPAVQLTEGHRYLVALRDLRSAGGATIAPSPAFGAYRDRAHAPAGASADFEPRRPHFEELFRELRDAGVDRGDLFLTWDFTVASRRNLTERVLHIRDDAFAALGDRNLSDRTITGRSPAYTITSVEDFADGPSRRRVDGLITVPNYLTPQVQVLPEEARDTRHAIADAVHAVPKEVTDALKPVTSAVPIDVLDVVADGALSVPGSRFNYDPTTGLPVVDPIQPTVDVPFRCEISRSSGDGGSRPMLYGHGLLGSRDEVGGGSTARLRERGFSPCAVDWWGFSAPDLPNIGVTLADLSNMPSVMDRIQQGFLNFLYLGRAFSHPQGLTASPAFRDPKGKPLVQAGNLAYDGNSQGGIMGGALTALAPDFERAVLGVPGMGYSLLLNRSVDWEGKYAVVYQAAYQDPIDQQLGYALMQMVWDRGESSGYAQQMTSDPLPNTPTHEVFLQVAFGDHQVSNVAAEIMGRTIGASLVTPSLAPGLHWSVDPTFGFHTLSGSRPHAGSLLVYWYAAGTGLKTPPNANLPSAAGKDPHGAPRASAPAADQVAAWITDGQLLDVCHGAPCTIPPPP